MRRPLVLTAFSLAAACTSFGAATDDAVPVSPDAAATTDASTSEGGALDGSSRFCDGRSALLCDDFEDGYADRWEGLPQETNGAPVFMRRVPSGGPQGVVAEIAILETPPRSDDNADLVAGPLSGTYVLGLALRVDQIGDEQDIEVASLKTASSASTSVALHLVLRGQEVAIAQYIEDSGYPRTKLGTVELGRWHRVEIEARYGPPNLVGGSFDGQKVTPVEWSTHAGTSLTGDLRMIAGLHFIKTFTGPVRYAIDDVLLVKPP